MKRQKEVSEEVNTGRQTRDYLLISSVLGLSDNDRSLYVVVLLLSAFEDYHKETQRTCKCKIYNKIQFKKNADYEGIVFEKLCKPIHRRIRYQSCSLSTLHSAI